MCAAVAAPPEVSLPHISIDRDARVVEFEARVSPLVHASDPRDDEFPLEQFVCIPDTKEHESLLVTDALPSHIHAALLLIGLEPGSPTTWTNLGNRVAVTPPDGPRVNVEFVHVEDGAERVISPVEWVRHVEGGEELESKSFVFAGSVIRQMNARERYEADDAGTVIGLASFGTEVLAWPELVSHEFDDGDLVWFADLDVIPPNGTPVTVRLTPVAD
ncbi:MAG: YdjY domain-containing protein [Planctomycetota bacterium]